MWATRLNPFVSVGPSQAVQQLWRVSGLWGCPDTGTLAAGLWVGGWVLCFVTSHECLYGLSSVEFVGQVSPRLFVMFLSGICGVGTFSVGSRQMTTHQAPLRGLCLPQSKFSSYCCQVLACVGSACQSNIHKNARTQSFPVEHHAATKWS